MINNLNKFKINDNPLSEYTRRKEFNLSNRYSEHNSICFRYIQIKKIKGKQSYTQEIIN